MSAKPEWPADPSTQITSLTTSPDKHSQRSNALCPSIFHLVRHNNPTDVSPLSTSVRLWQAAVYKVGFTVEEFPAAVLQRSNLFQKNFKNIYRGWWTVNINFLSFPYLCRLSGTSCVRTASDASKQQWLLFCTSETLNKAVTNWEARYTLDWGWETLTDDSPTQKVPIMVKNYV